MLKVIERIYQLILKLISVKGLCAILATVALFGEKINGYLFIVAWAIVIGGRTLEKVKGIAPDRGKDAV